MKTTALIGAKPHAKPDKKVFLRPPCGKLFKKIVPSQKSQFKSIVCFR